MRASHWSEKRAEDFCLSVRDGTHDSPKPTAYGKKLITSKNIIGSHISLENSYIISIEDAEKVDKRSLVEQWDVLISMIGTVGEVCLIKEKPDFSIKNIGLFKSKGKEEGVYLYYYLKSQLAKNYIENRLAGSTQKYISLTELRNIPIKYPKNREEMCAINYVLSYLDDKIELNHRTNETLEAMARALFRDWFVDFGPTRAKMAGEAPYLAPELWELFPDGLDEEGKPEGWNFSSIYDVASVVYGAPFASSLFNTQSEGIPLVRIRDLPSEKPSVWTTEVHPKGFKILPGMIVVGMDGEFRAHLWGGEEAWLNQRVCVFQPKDGISSVFLRETIIPQLKFIEDTEVATTVIHLGKGDIDAFKTLLPSHEIMASFSDLAQIYYDKIVLNKQEGRSLAQLRDLLLPKLMSGEISIRDAEKMVEDAA